MKLKFLVLILILMMVSMVNAEIRGVLLTPQATFRVNYGDTVNHYIGILNKNPFPVNISIIPSKDLNISFKEPTQFVLLPNQSKDLNYSVYINKTGNYSGYISVDYIGNNDSFKLQSILFFIVPESKETKIDWIFMLFLGIVVANIVFLVYKMYNDNKQIEEMKGGIE